MTAVRRQIGDRLRLHECLQRLRAESGPTFQKLSERSYVDVAYLHRIETGRATGRLVTC